MVTSQFPLTTSCCFATPATEVASATLDYDYDYDNDYDSNDNSNSNDNDNDNDNDYNSNDFQPTDAALKIFTTQSQERGNQINKLTTRGLGDTLKIYFSLCDLCALW